MMIRSFKMLPALAALSLVVGLACGNRAYADDLEVGSPPGPVFGISLGSINENGSGGNFQGSTLNGASLPWVYCTDLIHDVSSPGSYPDTTVTYNGSQNGGTVTNAGEVAALLVANANNALTNVTLEANLQAAIWYEIYNNGSTTSGPLTLTFSQGSAAGAAALIAALPSNTSGYVSQVAWLSPGNGTSTIFQGLVTSTPEPSSFAIAGIGGLGLLTFMRRRKIALIS